MAFIITTLSWSCSFDISRGVKMEKEPIIGEKIWLKSFKKEDMGLMAKWHNDPEIMRLFAITKESTEEYWQKWLEKCEASPNVVYFGIAKKGENELIGYVHLDGIMWNHRLCRDIGILIGEKSEWTKGYGTEAMKLMIDHAFNTLGLHRLELMTFPFNRRGLRVWEKCGFKKEGLMRKARLSEGDWHDIIFFGLLEDDGG
jgi:RimJ/RimL family protein N-acetyltransferase